VHPQVLVSVTVVTWAVHVQPSACRKSNIDGLDSHETLDDIRTGFPRISSIIDMMLLHVNRSPSILHDGSVISGNVLIMTSFCAHDTETSTDETINVVSSFVIVRVKWFN
jgi:hypothetical protein